MPYKVTGLHGLNAEGLSLKAARELVRQHLETPEMSVYDNSHESIQANGKVIFELYYSKDTDVFQDADSKHGAGLTELAKIEYVKGNPDAV
jgi:hypothetical protein